jgi:hypothetical protein
MPEYYTRRRRTASQGDSQFERQAQGQHFVDAPVCDTHVVTRTLELRNRRRRDRRERHVAEVLLDGNSTTDLFHETLRDLVRANVCRAILTNSASVADVSSRRHATAISTLGTGARSGTRTTRGDFILRANAGTRATPEPAVTMLSTISN